MPETIHLSLFCRFLPVRSISGLLKNLFKPVVVGRVETVEKISLIGKNSTSEAISCLWITWGKSQYLSTDSMYYSRFPRSPDRYKPIFPTFSTAKSGVFHSKKCRLNFFAHFKRKN